MLHSKNEVFTDVHIDSDKLYHSDLNVTIKYLQQLQDFYGESSHGLEYSWGEERVVLVTKRLETDEEFAARIEKLEEMRRRLNEQTAAAAARTKKLEEYNRLKKELGL